MKDYSCNIYHSFRNIALIQKALFAISASLVVTLLPHGEAWISEQAAIVQCMTTAELLQSVIELFEGITIFRQMGLCPAPENSAAGNFGLLNELLEVTSRCPTGRGVEHPPSENRERVR